MRQADSPKVRWHPRGLNNAAIIAATYYGVSSLPPWLSYSVGHVGTWLAYHLQRRGRRALVENFSVIFPEGNSREWHHLALRAYRSYARDVIDFIRSLRMTPAAVREMVSGMDTAALEHAMSEGRGAILLSGHFGNWEIGGVLLRRLTTYSLAVVIKAEPSQAVTRFREHLRMTLGIDSIEVRQHLDTALRIRSRLQKNDVVAMLLDRHLGKDRVEVSFFDRPTQFLRTPAMLASLSGAPLIPCFVYRDERGLAVECGPLIRVSSSGDRDANVREAIQAFAALLEGHIRRNPHYWYQFYPFWSSQDAPPEDTGAPS